LESTEKKKHKKTEKVTLDKAIKKDIELNNITTTNSSQLKSPPSRFDLGNQIEPKEIEYIDQIGSGVYGVVYKANVRGKIVAVKKLKKKATYIY